MIRELTKTAAAIFLFSLCFAADKLAVTTKTEGTVDVVRSEASQALKRGTILLDQDLVISKKDGQAVIMFLDDKSQLKIKGDTEIRITGERGQGAISKQINMDYGVLKASISEQRKGDFIIATPTSVASVKGTEFWIISDPDSGDMIISNSGSVELVNNVTGETIVVPAGTIVESTVEGEMNVLKTVKISGRASTAVNANQFSLQNIRLLEGEVEVGNISGVIFISDNTVYEGGAVRIGAQVTVRGAFDAQSGKILATLLEVSMPVTVEGRATSAVMANIFSISDVSTLQGSLPSPPAGIRVDVNTVLEGDAIVAGAMVTVTGYFNSETGNLVASRIVAVMPEKAIKEIIVLLVSGTAESGIANDQFSFADLTVLDGSVDAGNISDIVFVSDSTAYSGCAVVPGMTVIVGGVYNDSTKAISARSVTVEPLIINGIVTTPIVNGQFEISDITVTEGNLDPADLSGMVIITDDTDIDPNGIFIGAEVQIEKCKQGPEDTGDIIARRVITGERIERKLIIKLEDGRGNKKDLIITF
ncbi:MAG: FecR family protein [Candidatus Neomarinimicrobiota bacterium]